MRVFRSIDREDIKYREGDNKRASTRNVGTNEYFQQRECGHGEGQARYEGRQEGRWRGRAAS